MIFSLFCNVGVSLSGWRFGKCDAKTGEERQYIYPVGAEEGTASSCGTVRAWCPGKGEATHWRAVNALSCHPRQLLNNSQGLSVGRQPECLPTCPLRALRCHATLQEGKGWRSLVTSGCAFQPTRPLAGMAGKKGECASAAPGRVVAISYAVW